MKLVACDQKNINVGGYSKTANMEVLEEFRNSDLTCAEVKDFPHQDAKSCCSALRNTAKICKMSSINVIMRNGKVFLVKKDA